jgi:8-oxo-dGTP pyrophosphatase MutT (NUDIX family)
MSPRWKPNTTVAAVIEKDGLFLLVEEHTPEGLRLNNAAGHLDPGESPAQGCAREALEETAFDFAPTALVGVYLSRFQREQSTASNSVAQEGIVRTVWLSADDLRNSTHLHRSPLVLQCMEDYLNARRYPLELITTDSSVFER